MIHTQIASLDIETMGTPSLECLEGTVLGARYYCVQPTWHHWDEMIDWCVNTYGPTQTIWEEKCARWYANNAKIWFRDEADRTLFLLKWS
jgi:hypothetical protein